MYNKLAVFFPSQKESFCGKFPSEKEKIANLFPF